MLKGSTCDSRNGAACGTIDAETGTRAISPITGRPSRPRGRRFLFQPPSRTRVKVEKLLPRDFCVTKFVQSSNRILERVRRFLLKLQRRDGKRFVEGRTVF